MSLPAPCRWQAPRPVSDAQWCAGAWACIPRPLRPSAAGVRASASACVDPRWRLRPCASWDPAAPPTAPGAAPSPLPGWRTPGAVPAHAGALRRLGADALATPHPAITRGLTDAPRTAPPTPVAVRPHKPGGSRFRLSPG